MADTRGERNHNPCNLEFETTIDWVGQLGLENVPPGADYSPRFIRFDTDEHGIRAAAREFFNYQRLHGLDTIRKIVTRWAPPSENNTGAYINAVAHFTGMDPDVKLDLSRFDQLRPLVVAIIKQENGRCLYADDVIDAGVNAALA